jgi:hypothetical protein
VVTKLPVFVGENGVDCICIYADPNMLLFQETVGEWIKTIRGGA